METKLGRWSTEIDALRPAADGINTIVDRVNSLDASAGAPGTLVQAIPTAGVAVASVLRRELTPFPVKVTTSLGDGNYGARRFAGTIQYTSGSLSVPGSTVDPGADNILLVNLGEASAGAPLTPGAWVVAVSIGVAALPSGAPVALCVCGPSAGAMFPVKVSEAGGAQGTASAPASYTYSVTAISGATLLSGGGAASDIALARPRPNGAVTAGSGYGVAFYDAATPPNLVLWDAGEVPATTAC